jgi:hypothetical protein
MAELEAAGLVTLADKGYLGSTWAKVPYRGKGKPESQRQANRAHARIRGRVNARTPSSRPLKAWGILRKLRCCPWRASQLAKPSAYCSSARHNRDEKRLLTMAVR